ncbi:MAG: XdhC family protein [Bacteroidetes bacterium]|nr:XdhC family protein [Bacteroidota bacterium]
MNFWKILYGEIKDHHQVIMMYVIHSEGSSPGRLGFKMGVSSSGKLFGSIGGGFMEHKLVEWCKQELLKRDFEPFFKRQIHQASVPKDKSGMICSGEQTIAFYKLNERHLPLIQTIQQAISNHQYGVLELDDKDIQFHLAATQKLKFESAIHEDNWFVKEDIGKMPELHIVGGGHVGLALSKFAKALGFRITVYDDRNNLNTMDSNHFGKTIMVSDYEKIADYISAGVDKYVVLMSFGYRTDKVVLKQLIHHQFKYLGMMGSKEKVKQLFKELLKEGIDQSLINKVHSPIGIPIKSQTPEEIAISILAEMIAVKNK